MPAGERPLAVRDVVASDPWVDPFSDVLRWSARLLRAEGIDLLAATATDLERGTPVYVEASADLVAVQRRMVEKHIRSVPVLDGPDVLGALDLVELAARSELLSFPQAPA
jgi:CBS domain-containing protein